MVLTGTGQGVPSGRLGDGLSRPGPVGLAGPGPAVGPVAGARGRRDARHPGGPDTRPDGRRVRPPRRAPVLRRDRPWAVGQGGRVHDLARSDGRRPAQRQPLIAIGIALGCVAALIVLRLRRRRHGRRDRSRADAGPTSSGPTRRPTAVLTGTRRPPAETRGVRGHPTAEDGVPMTQVAEPGTAPPIPAPGSGQHWIGGRSVAGTSGREAPSSTPRPAELTKQVDFASVEEIAAAVAAAKAAFPGLARDVAVEAHRDHVPDPEPGRGQPPRDRRAPDRRARQGASDALGEIARGIEKFEFACGIPSLLKGGFSEQVSGSVDVDQIRQPLGVVAGITPFNFPAMVPMWMFARRSRPATRSSSSRRRRIRRRELPRRATGRGGRAGRRLQRRPRGQGGRRRILDHPTSRPSRSSARRRSPATSTRPGPRPESGSRPWRREEPHDRPARRGHRDGLRCGGLGRVRLGRRTVHGHRHDRGRRGRGRSAGRGDEARLPKIKVGPGANPRPRWARSSRRCIATRSRRTSTVAPPRARRSSPTAVTIRCRTTRTGSSWASRSSTT